MAESMASSRPFAKVITWQVSVLYMHLMNLGNIDVVSAQISKVHALSLW